MWKETSSRLTRVCRSLYKWPRGFLKILFRDGKKKLKGNKAKGEKWRYFIYIYSSALYTSFYLSSPKEKVAQPGASPPLQMSNPTGKSCVRRFPCQKKKRHTKQIQNSIWAKKEKRKEKKRLSGNKFHNHFPLSFSSHTVETSIPHAKLFQSHANEGLLIG